MPGIFHEMHSTSVQLQKVFQTSWNEDMLLKCTAWLQEHYIIKPQEV